MNKDITEFEELFKRLKEKGEYVPPYMLECILKTLEDYNYEPTDFMWDVINEMMEM